MKRQRAGEPEPAFGTLLDFLPASALIVLSDPDRLAERAAAYAEQIPPNDPFLAPWDDFLDTAARRGFTRLDLREEPRSTDVLGPPWEGFQSLDIFRSVGARAPDLAVAEAQRRDFFAQLHRWLRQGHAVHVFCNNEGERQRFSEVWDELGFSGVGAPEPGFSARQPEAAVNSVTAETGSPRDITPALHLGSLSRGFVFNEARLVVVTDAEIFGRSRIQRPRRLKSPHAPTSRSLLDIDFTELEEGDYVVHVQHGIGRYLGLGQLASGTGGSAAGVRAANQAEIAQAAQECLIIEYTSNDPEQPPPKLYVPVSEAHLVSRYVGAGKARPPLHTLGGTRWGKARQEAERAVRDLAADLLEIQAARETQPGLAFPSDSSWQREFEAAFLFEETPDQLAAIEATKREMEAARPMDRLICGDVGFGKTEVAIRAAFKAVMAGKQAAILVPTTVLAQQHFNTFRERMSDYPVRVELLSRFRSRREQAKVIDGLTDGGVDIVIGTHRLLQADVRFKDLGLVVIDEEQRFGVRHKEQLKRLRCTVDVLTLTATPIPRTLHLALSGARDMSTIETPPQDRLPIETIVAAYDERLIRDAIQRELNRQGQVFFLHNRVTTIDTILSRLRALVPHARIVVGHGQMHSDELEEAMTRFVNGEADVLLSTTIIESGLDIPNANTIIVDRADRFGLSELYQLRGRVGRYKHQAYAYLLIPRHAQLLADARRRMAAIRHYSSLGSGFKVALRDLEIRGAGNLLGPQQSGHISAVGFELYCQLLKQSITALKGEKVRPRIEVAVRLDFLAMNLGDEIPSRPPSKVRSAGSGTNGTSPVYAGLPQRYIPEPVHRVEIHRRLAQIVEAEELTNLRRELRDRFGPLPEAVELLLQVRKLKLLAAARDVTAIENREAKLMLTRNGDFVQVGGRFPRLSGRSAKSRLLEIQRFLAALV